MEFKLKNAELIFIQKNENQNSQGAWVCSNCGAEYERSQYWIPPCNWCMKCHIEWENLNLKRGDKK